MKRVLSLVLASVMVVSMFAGLQISSSAYFPEYGIISAPGGNVQYVFDISTGVLRISGYGEMEDFLVDAGDEYEFADRLSPFYWEESIEKVIIEQGVTSIGRGAFVKCKNLKIVTIASTVKNIQPFAFYQCEKLTSVSLPVNLSTIGVAAFGASGLTAISLPKNITKIPERTFAWCSNLTSVEILGNVTEIGVWAFFRCYSLTSITLPKNMDLIDSGAFKECTSLQSIDMPERLTKFGSNVFEDCSSLKSLLIPEGISRISVYLINNCSSLEKLYLPQGISPIFADPEVLSSSLSSLDGIYIKDVNSWASSCTYSYGEGEINILEYAHNLYVNNEPLRELTLTNNNRWRAFAGCHTLEDVTITGDVRDEVFKDCVNLKTVTISSKYFSIGKGAFENCTGITDVYFCGSETRWNNLIAEGDIKENNQCLTNATIHFAENPVDDHSEHDVVYMILTPEWIECIDGYAMMWCMTCEKAISEPFITNHASQPHNFVSTERYCLNGCGTENPDYSENPHTHSYSFSITTQPTCTQEGLKTFTCECGDTYTQPIPALGHDLTFHNAKDETCTKNGNKSYYECLLCHNYFNDDEGKTLIVDKTEVDIPALGHDYKTFVTAPKANALGYTQYKCSRCSQWKKDAKGNVLKDKFTAPTGKPAGFKCTARTAAAMKFTWTKTSGVSGYQIQLLNSAGKSAVTATTTGNAYTFSKLAAGHAYKARVRFYIKAADGKNYYGAWSTISSPTLPAGTSLTKVIPAKKAFTAQWKKASVTGYQLQYATNAKFTKATTKTIKGAAKYSLKVANLKAGTKYFVRVRTYKTIGGKNYYSTWSAAKAVKTK